MQAGKFCVVGNIVQQCLVSSFIFIYLFINI